MSSNSHLKRSLSLPLLVFYGIGTILGAGIYVLVGKVAGAAGIYAPFAFLIAATTASFTAYSYAQLAKRFPKSAGEVIYVQNGLQKKWLSTTIGWLIVITGTVSAATITKGFVGYLQIFLDISDSASIILVIAAICGLAILGITESVRAATVITLIEIGGLIFIIYICRGSFTEIPGRIDELLPSPTGAHWFGIFSGAFLAFYAYIGFEDMVNVAEETINPERNVPRAIFIALVFSSVLYILVALVAVLLLSPGELQNSTAPIADIFVKQTGYSPKVISFVSMLAVINGALIQVIMASRILYGMGRSGHGPKILSRINPSTRTPLLATVLISMLVLILALIQELEFLARTTSLITLIVFAFVNISLVAVFYKEKVPLKKQIMPSIGLLVCIFMLFFY